MPLRPPESYELDRASSETPPPLRRLSQDSVNSDLSEFDEFDPLRSSKRPYTDDASLPLRSVFESEKAPSRKNALSFRGKGRGARSGWWWRWLVPGRMCCWMMLLFIAALVLLLSAGGIWVYKAAVPLDGQSEPWYPSPRGGTVKSWSRPYEKAADLVGRMTLVEKVNVTTGTGWSMGMCVGNTGAVSRLGFPSLCLQDGPLGLRFVDNATAFPAGVTVGATWNKELMFQRGKAHGEEARKKGVNILLGPSMGPLGRLPAGGRNWEGFGIDPVLQGIAAAETIKGIQSEGVIATAKHYVANEQEHFRKSWEWGPPNAISSNIDDRTMHEIYAWPFMDSVRAGVGSVMCSYNQVNNSYACQNSKLLNGVLKDEMGFQGFVQSDWLAQRSGVASALAGLDMSMPGDGLRWQDGNSLWGAELTKAALNGSVPMERLNDMAMRVVAAWFNAGQDDLETWPKEEDGGGPNFSSWTDDEVGQLYPGSPGSTETGVVNKHINVQSDHGKLARKIAAEGIVLVKNENATLPLNRNGTGIKSVTGAGKLRIGIFGEDAFPNPDGNNACVDRGCNKGTLASGWGSGAVEVPYLITPAEALHANFDQHHLEISDFPKNKDSHAPAHAAEQDLCLVFINADAGEGYLSDQGIRGDRNDLYPQKGGDALVQHVAANCGGIASNGTAGSTIVVLHNVGPVILERWIEYPGVKAVLIAHLPGEESGNALADILFGDVNPSGHLPYTIAKAEEDYGPDSKILYYPNGIVPQQNFSEGLYVDYRYFDKQNITPRYEFGFGLSYTTFHLSSLFTDPSNADRSLVPAPRPEGLLPPKVSTDVPDAREALWPKGMRKLKKFVYPYLDAVSQAKPSGQYPYPDGYTDTHEPSPAGGEQGGNPALYDTMLTVQASLTNLGAVPGDCVVQCYISYPEGVLDHEGVEVDMPVKVLRGFEKIAVGTSNAARRQKVSFELTRRDLSYWDVKRQNWVMAEGSYKVHLGYSSRDLEVEDEFGGGVKIAF